MTVLIYNAAFDLPMLQRACERLGKPCPLAAEQTRCIMLLFAAYVGMRDWRHGSMGNGGGYRWQALPGSQHRAAGDCRAVLDLLHVLANAVPPAPFPVPPPEAFEAP